jgi:hypothetical protein
MAQCLTTSVDISLAIEDHERTAACVKNKGWLEQCLGKHDDCGFEDVEFLPKRVIGVKTLQLLTPELQQGRYISKLSLRLFIW